jgi:proteasome assembly chaperone (PAC2) family protein
VAINAGVYLLAKLDMQLIAELKTGDLFDLDHVEVKNGIVQPTRRPRNLLFAWTHPEQKHDLVVFLGEAQPPIGKYAFCRQLIAYARELGVERVFTFAAMATAMHPEHPSQVFAAATDQEGLEEPADYYRGNPGARYAARRAKLSRARHQRRERNLQMQQRTLSFPGGEEVASD